MHERTDDNKEDHDDHCHPIELRMAPTAAIRPSFGDD